MNDFVPYTVDLISANMASATGGDPGGKRHVRFAGYEADVERTGNF